VSVSVIRRGKVLLKVLRFQEKIHSHFSGSRMPQSRQGVLFQKKNSTASGGKPAFAYCHTQCRIVTAGNLWTWSFPRL
jgi:hypothetical protein